MEEKLDINFKLRSAVPEDLNFIISSWLKSYKNGSFFALRIPDKIFYSNHHPIVMDLLATCNVSVVCLNDDINCIIGWMCSKDNTLHYVFVKEAWRNLGVMRILFEDSGIDSTKMHVSHATKIWFDTKDRPGLESHFKGAVYNPYSIFKGE